MGIGSVFRMVGRDDEQSRAAAMRMAADWPHGHIAILDDGDTYGKGLADVVRVSLKPLGVHPVLDERYRPGAQTYADIIGQLKAAAVEAVFIGGYDLDIAVFAREAAAAGLHLTILGGDALVGPTFWDAAGPSAESAIFPFSPNPLQLPAGRALVAAARRDGVEFSAQSVLAYASVEVWAGAVEKVRSFNGAAVAAALHNGQFASTIGTVRFDRKGDIMGSPSGWLWFRWRASKIEPVPSSLSAGN
jgi:branched-chain amino acid transport system substrate-binding protein